MEVQAVTICSPLAGHSLGKPAPVGDGRRESAMLAQVSEEGRLGMKCILGCVSLSAL